MKLRYPWFTNALADRIKESCPNDDEALLDVFASSTIDWHMTSDYEEEVQRLADVSRLPVHKIKGDAVLAEIVVGLLNYRIRIFSMSLRELYLERLRLKNANWQNLLKSRREDDPLCELRQPRYSEWMTKQQWSRDEFAGLILRIDPAAFDERMLELATPYSMRGNSALSLLKKLGEAVADQQLKLPNKPKTLVSWALQRGIKLPLEMIPTSPRGAREQRNPPVASAQTDRIRDVIVSVAMEHRMTVTKDRLIELIEEVVGAKQISLNAINTRIWKAIPPELKSSSGGPPRLDWLEAWPPNRRTLKDALVRALSRKTL